MFSKSLSHVWHFVTPWTVAHQVPLPMGFPRQENWSRLQFPSRDLPTQGSNSCLLLQQIDSLPLSHQGSPFKDQIRSVAQSCPTFCDPMNHSSQASLSITISRSSLRLTSIVSDAIQPSHPLASPSPPALNPSQHQSLFQWVNSSHEVAKVLEFQL